MAVAPVSCGRYTLCVASTSLAGSPSAAPVAGNAARATTISAIVRRERATARTGVEWRKVRVQSTIEDEPYDRDEV